MVKLGKLLKLGGFSEQLSVLKKQVEHLGFARKFLPPDTPHSENKPRWALNSSDIGQKVEDTSTATEEVRAKWIAATESTYNVPEESTINDRNSLVLERCDYIRTLCALAEKGDEASGEYLLQILQKEPAPEVRKIVMRKLVFAARGPPTPYHKRLVEGTLCGLADPVAEVRGLATWLQERSIRDWDIADMQTQIAPQRRKDSVARRGECSAPGPTESGTYQSKGPQAGGAWQQVRDLAMAVNNQLLINGVINMMTHPVLPVRIAAWETFGAKETSGVRGRCSELEALTFQERLKFEEMQHTLLQLQRDLDRCTESIMEENRDKIASVIERERTRADLTAVQVEELVDKYRNELAAENEEYVRLKNRLQGHQKKFDAQKEELESGLVRYNALCADLNKEIMFMIGTLLEENCAILEGVNKLCGNSGQGNWYVRRCLVRILEPMAVAGEQASLRLLEKAQEDRSPYVRRTVQRCLRAVRLAERERTAAAEISQEILDATRPKSEKTKAELEAEEKAAALKAIREAEGLEEEDNSFEIEPLAATLEEKRAALKVLKQQQEEADEKARIRAMNVMEFTWQEVADLFESLRPKFEARVDVYKKQVRLFKYTGAQLCEICENEDSMQEAFKMKMRKHRIFLKKHVNSLLQKWHDAVDDDKKEQRAQALLNNAAQEYAYSLGDLRREQRAKKSSAAIKSARRLDNYAYGMATGLGSVLNRDEKGRIMFRRVMPCGGLVSDGDMLVKIGNTPVEGLSISDVKQLFDAGGEMVPCLVLVSSEKEQRRQLREERLRQEERDLAEAQAAGKKLTKRQVSLRAMKKEAINLDADIFRTVHIICQPDPFREKYIESMGLDVEVYQGDATRSLQVMTFLQRNGFANILTKILVDLNIKKLEQLAERYRDDFWIQTVGIKTKRDEHRFKKLLERLAFRYGMRDHMPEIALEDTRPDAHEGWVFITGNSNTIERQYLSHHRTCDQSQDINEFFRFGRTPIVLNSKFSGMEYTLCWNPDLKLAVELMHASAGTLRIAKLAESQNLARASSFERTRSDAKTGSLPGISGEFEFWVFFSDGSMERTDRLNCEGLLKELVSNPPPNSPGPPAQTLKMVTDEHVQEELRIPSTSSRLPSIPDAVPQKGGGTSADPGPDAAPKESISEEMPATTSGIHPGVLTSGANLGSPSKHGRHFRFHLDSGTPASPSSACFKASHITYDALSSEEIDRAWYVKGPGRGAFRRRKAPQLKVVQQVDLNLSTDLRSSRNKSVKKTSMISGSNMGFFSRKKPDSDDESEEESEPDSDEEDVVGYHCEPLVGHRVILRDIVHKRFPELVKETDNATGTITWVDPTDADGDGITGDISEVKWDNGYVGDYRTGFEGTYRLQLDPDEWETNERLNIGAEADEEVVGLDVEPLEGQRVVLMKQALRDNPSLWQDSKGGPGTILWVDPEDADGDGITGDICEVKWDLTDVRADYRTGFEGAFRLALYNPAKPKTEYQGTRKQVKRDPSGPRFKTIDVGRQQPPDDPWAFFEKAVETEKRLEEAELFRGSGFIPEKLVPFKMAAAGPQSSVSAGSWKMDTKEQNNGTTIQILFDPVSKMLGNQTRIAHDAKKLGLKFYHGSRQHYVSEQAKHMASVCPFKPFAAHLTGEGVVVVAEDPDQSNLIRGSKGAPRLPVPGRAAVITPDGIDEMGVEDACLVVEGIPRRSIAEILALKRNETPGGLDGFSGSEGTSRPGTKGSKSLSRSSSLMSKTPQKIRRTAGKI